MLLSIILSMLQTRVEEIRDMLSTSIAYDLIVYIVI